MTYTDDLILLEQKAIALQNRAARRDNSGDSPMDYLKQIHELENNVAAVPQQADAQIKETHDDTRLTDDYKQKIVADFKAKAYAAITNHETRAASHYTAALEAIQRTETAHEPEGIDLAVQTMQQAEARPRVRALLEQGHRPASIADRAAKARDIPAMEALRAEHVWQTAGTDSTEDDGTLEHIDRAAAPLLPTALGKARLGRHDLNRAHNRFTVTVKGVRAQVDGDRSAALRTALARHYS